MELMVWRDTSIASASCCCESWRAVRSVRTSLRITCKADLTSVRYGQFSSVSSELYTRDDAAIEIRPATEADAAAIAAIYNEGIEDRTATFETRLRASESVAGWLGGGLPVLVAADADGTVLGFARAAPYSDRCVYA